eukprot:m.378888 g.378888  ORF g.378888 m.378888 type:complete len:552 (-) comp20940_c0_seq1:169-1824(-)
MCSQIAWLKVVDRVRTQSFHSTRITEQWPRNLQGIEQLWSRTECRTRIRALCSLITSFCDKDNTSNVTMGKTGIAKTPQRRKVDKKKIDSESVHNVQDKKRRKVLAHKTDGSMDATLDPKSIEAKNGATSPTSAQQSKTPSLEPSDALQVSSNAESGIDSVAGKKNKSNKVRKTVSKGPTIGPTRGKMPRQPRPATKNSGTNETPTKLFTCISWNVDGIRAKGRKEKLHQLVHEHHPDLLCIQETKLQEKHEKDWISLLAEHNYSCHLSSSTAKAGYAGTAVYYRGRITTPAEESEKGSKQDLCSTTEKRSKSRKTIASFFSKTPKSAPTKGQPQQTNGDIQVSFPVQSIRTGIHSRGMFDQEGRSIIVEFENFYVINLYVPNSGRSLERLDDRVNLWDEDLRAFATKLDHEKPVILTGDFNVAHLDADIYNYDAKHIAKTSGCTPRERESFGKWLEDGCNFKDAFRHFHADVKGAFTFYSTMKPEARLPTMNQGLRLDYFLCSKRLFSSAEEHQPTCSVHDSWLFDPKDTTCVSDHCPIGLELRVNATSA